MTREDKAKINGSNSVNAIDYDKCYLEEGLTKREYFAGLAMQGLCANPNTFNMSYEEIAQYSIKQADELLKQLQE